MSRWRPGVASISAASVLWGLGTVGAAAIIDAGMPAPLLTCIELGTSVCFLAVMCRVRGVSLPTGRRNHLIGTLGLLEPGATYLLVNLGLARTSASNASLITAAQPVVVAALAVLIFGHRLPAGVVGWMVVVVAGTVTVVAANGTTGGGSLNGDLLVVAGILCASLYVLISGQVATEVDPLPMVLLQQLWAFGLVAVAALASSVTWTGGSEGAWTWVAAPILGVGASSLTFWLYLSSLQHLPAATAAQFLALVPVVGYAAAVTVLDEPLRLWAVVGAVAVVLALVGIARIEADRELRTEPR